MCISLLKDAKFNFSFGPKLAEVLKKICTFNADAGELVDEAERCEKVCQEALLVAIDPQTSLGEGHPAEHQVRRSESSEGSRPK